MEEDLGELDFPMKGADLAGDLLDRLLGDPEGQESFVGGVAGIGAVLAGGKRRGVRRPVERRDPEVGS